MPLCYSFTKGFNKECFIIHKCLYNPFVTIVAGIAYLEGGLGHSACWSKKHDGSAFPLRRDRAHERERERGPRPAAR